MFRVQLAGLFALCLLLAACGQDNSSTSGDDAGAGAASADEVDNDGDGQIDLDDPGCTDADDDDESDEPVATECDDGIDNDGDGQIDLEDRGCASRGDDNEGDERPLPECSDGVDNDDDGYIDYPEDPGCGSDFDGSEAEDTGPVLPQCANGLDDDNDGLVDLSDPGCSSVADPREQHDLQHEHEDEPEQAGLPVRLDGHLGEVGVEAHVDRREARLDDGAVPAGGARVQSRTRGHQHTRARGSSRRARSGVS